METEKKQWTKPELIVLVRNKPEEAVLGACKMVSGPDGPLATYIACGTDACAGWCLVGAAS
jgi:hypothetical protein